MFEFCLIVYMTMDDPQYIGNFVSCAHANQYVQEFYPTAEYTVCLYQDYIVLPEHFVRKEIDYGKRK